MKREDVKIGMKVVPHSKSVWCVLYNSMVWIRAKQKNQPFLYVTKFDDDVFEHVGQNIVVLNEDSDSSTGDYFLASDFEPYVEEPVIPTIGTYIKIIDGCTGAYGANGESGIVVDKCANYGLMNYNKGFNVEIENGKVWRIGLESKYEIIKKNTEEKTIENKSVVVDTITNVSPKQEIHVYTDGKKTTTAINKENGKVIKKAYSKCHPDDTFDFSIGSIIAVNRLFNSEFGLDDIIHEEKKEVKPEVKPEAKLIFKHFSNSNEFMGNIGESTLVYDALGSQLYIGDCVDTYNYNKATQIWEKVVSSVIIKYENLITVMGYCGDDIAKRKDIRLIKTRSYQDIKHNEKINFITYIKE